MSTLYVTPDGTCYTNSEWDEAGRELGIYKNGDVIGQAAGLHGWGSGGGKAVTATDRYLYVAMSQSHSGKPGEDYPPEGTTWYSVRRYSLTGSPAPFEQGRLDRSLLVVNTTQAIAGLAAANNELFVSDPDSQKIRVYQAETMTELRSFAVDRPGAIAADAAGNLWMVQAAQPGTAAKVLHYSPTGDVLKTIENVVNPTAVAVDPQGRLLVADNGPRQQVLIYDVTRSPVLVDYLGTEQGWLAGKPGEITADKLHGLSGVGADAAGNLYVSLDGFNRSGAVLKKFSPQKQQEWQLVGLQFLDTADVDPASDGTEVFTKNEYFVMDYRQSNGQEWQYKGYTIDPFRYPDDARLHTTPTAPLVRRINHQRFLFLSSEMMAEQLLIYRFEDLIAIPCGIFARGPSDWPIAQPSQASWHWQDANGDGAIQAQEYEVLGDPAPIWGWEVDSRGDIWQASETGTIWHYPQQGLDRHGCPIYTKASSETIAMPTPFTQLQRIKYFPDTDVMYLAGYTQDHPKPSDEWGGVGSEIIRYDHWKDQKELRSRIVLDAIPAGGERPNKTMDVAGGKVFAAAVRTAEVYIYDAETGEYLDRLAPGPEVANESGWIDIPYALRAYQRADNEYLVFVEEDLKAKTILYRFKSIQ